MSFYHGVLQTARGVAFASSLAMWAVSVGAQGLRSTDLSRLRSVGQVALSPDGQRIAYTVANRDRPGRSYQQMWILDVATGQASRVGDEKSSFSLPHWSPDSKSLAYDGNDGRQSGLWVAHADGSQPVFLSRETDPNLPLPGWLGHELLVIRDPGQGDNVLVVPGQQTDRVHPRHPGHQRGRQRERPGRRITLSLPSDDRQRGHSVQ